MPRVIQIRDVPDDVHATLVDAARAQRVSLTRYLLLELEHLARRAQAVEDNRSVVTWTQSRVGGHVDRRAILDAIHDGRGV